MMRLSKSVLVVLSLLVVPSLLPAQETAAAEETVQVNLVEIPVNVFDRAGNAVRGLKPENFEVYDDGKRRKVTHFEEIDLATISVDEPQILTAPARRNFMLVFDLSHSTPRTILRAREAAREFIETLPHRDLACVATFSVEDGFRLITSFTTDRPHLQQAVRTLGFTRFYQTFDPLLLGGADVGMMGSPSASADTHIEREFEEIVGYVKQQMDTNDDNIRRNRIERQLQNFAELARVLNSVRGRKQLVLLSEGFDGRLVQGRERLTGLDMESEQNAQLRGEVWKIDTDQRFGNTKALRDLSDMARMFRASDVTLHAIDIKGIRAPNDPRTGSQRTSNESLYLLSNPTGGEVFKNNNDLTEAFARMLKQQEVVYILGFQTKPSGNPGKFHDLKVKVRVIGYSGLRVSHRAGYYEPRLQVNAIEQILSATDILMNDIPFEEIPTNVLVTPFPQKDGNAEVPVIVEISGNGLLDRVRGNMANGELFIYAFDQSNSVKDYLFQIFSLDLERIRGTLTNSGLKYYGILSLPPGDYTIKTLVRVAESGLNGFTRTRLRVPAFGEVTVLPPLLFEEPDRWILLRGVSKAGGDIEYPFTIGEESFIPSVRPRMEVGQTYRLAMFTYNLPVEEIELVARLDGADGSHRNPALKLLGRSTDGENGAEKLLLAFTPTGLAPGNYLLSVSVRRQDDKDEANFKEVSLPVQIERLTPR